MLTTIKLANRIEIRLATIEQKAVIERLAQLYVHDLSEFMGWDCPYDGVFAVRDMSCFWRPGNYALLLYSPSHLVGFVLIDRRGANPEADYNMGEFFIMRKFRRQGIGGQVARKIFEALPGLWDVMQLPPNKPAIAFWRRIITEYCQGVFSEKLMLVPHLGFTMNVMHFDSRVANASQVPV
jgi:predicted acetyltransferase